MGVATVAVFFTDLADSTETAERLGPTAAEHARRSHFDLMRKVLTAHDGTEIKTTGDGLMLVFKGPSDAVACASAMQFANSRLAGASEMRPGMRIGIAFGEATEDAGDWYGMPVVRAARLCAAAAPNQILVDQFVAALADYASAQFEPRGDLALKGIAQPVPALEIVWASPDASVPMPVAFEAAPGSTFVGRSRHLDALRDAWTRAAGGETALALLAGEPGAGKTSIAAAFAREVHGQGALALFGRCDDGLGLAYQPFAQALEHYVRYADERILQAHVNEHGGETLRLVPHLAARVPAAPEPTIGDPGSEQWRLFNATRELLAAAGDAGPVLLVIDDLHWATAPTLQLLSYLLRSEAGAAMLIVATYRDTELARTHPLADTLAELRRLSSIERIRVGGLEEHETERLVEAVAGHDIEDEGRALARALHTRTEGNPFFAIELLRHLAESGAIDFQNDQWRARESVDAGGLPEGVKEVIGRRLGRLPDATNAVLAVSSIAGLEFDAQVVARVLALDLTELLDALDHAIRAGIVRETATSHRFTFTHALIRSTVLEEAGASRQVHLHGRVAEAIEAVHAHDLEPWLADLAFHHAEAAHAGRTAPAVEFALRAAAQARGQAAIAAAIAHLERGLAAARLAAPPDPEQLARVLVALAETTAVESPAAARVYATEASEVAEAAGLPELVAAAAASMWSVFNTTTAGAVTGDRWLLDLCDRALGSPTGVAPALRARVMAMHGLLSEWAGEVVDPARADEAVALAEADGDPASLVVAALAQWSARLTAGPSRSDWQNYLDVTDAAVATTPDRHLRGMAAVYTSWGASTVGDRDRVDLAREQVENAYAALGSPRMRSWAAWLRAMAALREGSWDDAIAATTEAREITADKTIGNLAWGVHVGTALLHQGRASEVLASFDDAERLSRSTTAATAFRSLVEGLAGDHEAARRSLSRVVASGIVDREPSGLMGVATAAWAAAVAGDRRAARVIEASLRPYRGLIAAGGMAEFGAIDRFSAMLAALDGRHDEADELFRSGLELEERFGGVVMAVHTRYWWARCFLERDALGDRERAAQLVRECIEVADRLGMAQVATDARSLGATPRT